MAGWYELSKSSDGQFRFVLKARNSEIILTSEAYKSLTSAKNGIASVQKNASDTSRYEKLESKNGKSYFNIKAANHQVIGVSQMYASAASRDAGIKSVQSNGVSDTIKDLTAPKKPDVKKPDVKKTDAKKPDTKKLDVKKTDTKKLDTKKADVKKLDTKKADVKKPDTKKADVKKPDTKKADVKKTGKQ